MMDRREMLKRALLFGAASLTARSDFARPVVSAGKPDPDTLFLQKLLDSAKPGGTVSVPASTYQITQSLRVDVPRVRIDGQGAEIRQLTRDQSGLIINAPGVSVANLALTGSGALSIGHGVGCFGRPDAYLAGLELTRVKMQGWAYGLLARFCESVSVLDNTITDVSYAAVMFESSRNSRVGSNTIRRVTGRPNAYGIAVSRKTGPLADYPLSSGFEIFSNRISDVPYWEGIDTHGGQDIEIHDNEIINARIGLMMTYSEGFAPRRCRAHHNVVRAGTASPQTGAEIVGLPSQHAEDCAIEYNSIDGFGTTGSVNGGSVRVQYADRPKVVWNRITNSLQSALVLFGDVQDADVSDNTIIGIDARVGAYIAAIKVPGGTVTGRIANNHIDAGIAAGIRAYAPQRILVEQNDITTTGLHYHPSLSYFLTR
jgi:hypothetical protein